MKKPDDQKTKRDLEFLENEITKADREFHDAERARHEWWEVEYAAKTHAEALRRERRRVVMGEPLPRAPKKGSKR